MNCPSVSRSVNSFSFIDLWTFNQMEGSAIPNCEGFPNNFSHESRWPKFPMLRGTESICHCPVVSCVFDIIGRLPNTSIHFLAIVLSPKDRDPSSRSGIPVDRHVKDKSKLTSVGKSMQSDLSHVSYNSATSCQHAKSIGGCSH